MAVYLSDIIGSASIGVYSLANDHFVVIPTVVPLEKAKRTAEWLKVKLVHTSIGGSLLAGALACANSNGILLPHSVRNEELAAIKAAFEGNIVIMETKKTAYGNMVLTNDKGAIVDPNFTKSEIERIADTLGVETITSKIAGLPYVGSLAIATNNGVLAHPLVKVEEKKILEDILKVHVDVGTINCGIPYVGTGLVGNKHAAVAGSMTTGPEIFIIGNALDVVQEDE